MPTAQDDYDEVYGEEPQWPDEEEEEIEEEDVETAKRSGRGSKSVQKKPLTFIDLFAGIGGVRIALERNGMDCVFTSEIDKYCQEMYGNYFKDTVHGDITKIDENSIPDHDILTGGFPCQSFSIIGKGKGFADTRGTLFFDIERILTAKRPKAILLENVQRLSTHDNGRTMATILDKLDKLGYFTHWKVLNGLDFGVPQRRTRTIIVGFQKNYPFTFPEPVPVSKRMALEEILEKNIDPKHFLSEKMRKKFADKVPNPPKEITIWHENKSGNIGIHEYSCALRANASFSYLTVNGKRRLTPREMFRLQGFPDDYPIIVSDAQARKQAGNSVVIPKIQAVGEAMVKAMNKSPIPHPKQKQLIDA